MFALDTNTISYYFRGEPQVVHRLQALALGQIAVPSVVVYELRYGLMRLNAAAAQPRMEALSRFLAPLRVLDFDEASAQTAAALRASLEAQGTPIGPHDLLIAATALRHGAALVTRNIGEFSRVQGLQVINWFDAGA
ncbi:MAG: type II toxin-antitoxin system VapC family toxin [Serpentinimonas sp.]|jgi:tRNA(fMet)-specific endonuclease VapC|nr:type II toxin-antitoxin system VapC family toxin [Serpentinimonas sp.]